MDKYQPQYNYHPHQSRAYYTRFGGPCVLADDLPEEEDPEGAIEDELLEAEGEEEACS